MSSVPAFTVPVYCTDEDIAVRAGMDFVALAPFSQRMGGGNDGVFLAADRWTLTSASAQFLSNGVHANQVVWLQGPKTAYAGGGVILAIDSVQADSITLRRLHKDLGVGDPPAPAAGLTGVVFLVNTLDPQIEEASYDLKRRYGIDENVPPNSSGWMYDQRDLRMATVLTVLQARYVQEARGDKGDFPRKIGLLSAQLASVLERVEVRWGSDGKHPPSSSIFGANVMR
jgi:hypothetical protein